VKSGAWPLWVELSLTVLLVLVVSHVLILGVIWSAWAGNIHREKWDAIEGRISALVPLFVLLPETQWDQLRTVASKKSETFSIDERPSVRLDGKRNSDAEESLAHAIPALRGDGAVRQIRVSQRIKAGFSLLGDKRRRGYVGMDVAVPLPNGRWLNAKFRWPDEDGLMPGLAASLGVTAVAMCLLSIWLAGRLGSPLEQIADASRVMQAGRPVMPLRASGPSVIRSAVQSFNDMAQRLMPIMDGQRLVLASVGHDLRTPIASLRIKSELIEDEELKQEFAGSLDELQSMTEAALEASLSGVTGEAERRVDLAALAESVCEDLRDLGLGATFVPAEPFVVTCRPAEIRRVVRNLVENAIKYGHCAQVSVSRRASFVTVVVDDEGPGIPVAELVRVFEPFARLASHRAAAIHGHGLGLTISRTIARAHGGDVTLANRAEGGLRAELTLRF
jgi:signal transduction histidine kinase